MDIPETSSFDKAAIDQAFALQQHYALELRKSYLLTV